MLTGKNAIVTGASRGIGAQIAKTLAKNGGNQIFRCAKGEFFHKKRPLFREAALLSYQDSNLE